MESREATQFLHTIKQIKVYSYLSSSVIIFIIIYYFYFHRKTENIYTPREGRVCGVVHGEEIRPEAK
jgi:hypothetical protein